ncbi:MAG: glycosyltransferase [Bowdeniella nasicola]|nr:glycosyltransferase [Bowdeniella nasicola]
MKSPEVSVIIPSRGGASRLPGLIEALAGQQDAPSFDVLVVLDGDIDNSAGTLEELSQAHPELRLDWEVFPENRGRVAALNRGIEASRGAVVVRCDDDLVPRADYITQHAAAHRGERIGAVGLYRNIYPDSAYAHAYGREQDEAFRQQAYDTPQKARWRYWAGNCSAPREACVELGGYDPRFDRYGWEDIDFGYRLQQAGWPVHLVPELETAHRVAATTVRVRAMRALHAGAAQRAFETKHGLDLTAHPRGPWGVLVRTVAAVGTERVLSAAGGAVDRALPRLPAAVGRKAVAALVEGASLSGIRNPDRARDRF